MDPDCAVGILEAFERRHPEFGHAAAPVSTRRFPLLKAADLCALAPERAAQSLVDKGLAEQYEYARQMMQDLPYGKWRD